MKTIKQLTILGVTIVLGLTSCTMERRIYTTGCYTEWHKNKNNPDQHQVASSTLEQNKTVVVEQLQTTTNEVDNSVSLTVMDDKISASVDYFSILPINKKISLSKKVNIISDKTKNTSETKTFRHNKKQLKNQSRGLKRINSFGDKRGKGGNGALKALVLGGIILGFLIFIVVDSIESISWEDI